MYTLEIMLYNFNYKNLLFIYMQTLYNLHFCVLNIIFINMSHLYCMHPCTYFFSIIITYSIIELAYVYNV